MKRIISLLLVLCISLQLIPFALADNVETGKVGEITIEQPNQSITGGSNTNTEKSQDQINDEKIDSQLQEEFDKLFPEGFNPEEAQSWINSQKDAIYDVQKQELNKTLLEMYLKYLENLRNSIAANGAYKDVTALQKPVPSYIKGDTTTYSGGAKALVNGSTIAEGLDMEYALAALDVLIKYLNELYNGGLDDMASDFYSSDSDLLGQMGLTPMTIEELLEWGIDAGMIRPDFGYDGIALPSTIEDLQNLLNKYLEMLNNGESTDLVLYKITEYSVKSYTHKHLVQKTPTGSYVWQVTDPSGSVIAEKTTSTRTLKILFQQTGTYTVTADAVCNVVEGDRINGYQNEYWVICHADGSDAVLIKADSKEFSAVIKTSAEKPNMPLRFKEFPRNVTERDINMTLIMDINGNTMAPADGFTTERR